MDRESEKRTVEVDLGIGWLAMAVVFFFVFWFSACVVRELAAQYHAETCHECMAKEGK